MNDRMTKTIMIMAGGTGGHIFPALTIADALKKQGHRIIWLGGKKGLEHRLIPDAGYPLHTLKMQGFRGKSLLARLRAPWMVIQAIQQAIAVIKTEQPALMIGFGGYPSFAGGLAALLRGLPLVIHEQNAIPGLTNRILQRFAQKTFTAFPDVFQGDARTECVGNPIRPAIAQIQDPSVRYAQRKGPLQILVIGGSLGAQALNALIPQALKSLPHDQKVQITHQSGEQHLASLITQYQAANISDAHCVAFIDDMAAAYAAADLVICRAGALTVSELAAAGVASILVPLPSAVDDHQTANARYLADHGAGLLMPQSTLTPDRLAEQLTQLNRDTCALMAQKARSLAAVDTVALFMKATHVYLT